MTGPIWAEIGKVKGTESLSITAEPPKSKTCEVVLRYRDDIGPGDVIGHGSRSLHVVNVISFNPAAEETTVLCREAHG